MEQAVQELVKMGDIASLYEIMTEHDDFIYSLDAAEGLITLGDERGADFLMAAAESEDEDIRDVAREILDSPEVVSKLKTLEGASKKDNVAALAAARERIAAGKKVFIYKTIFLPATYFISADPSDDGDYVEALNDFGFEGWEVAAYFPMSTLPGRGSSPITLSGKVTGGHFLIKKEISASDNAELEDL
jgi:hypothetical protein